nr:MAG TPA: tail tape measure [Caudoviricetes sp.]
MIARELVTLLRFRMERAGLNQFLNGLNQARTRAQAAANDIRRSFASMRLQQRGSGAIYNRSLDRLGIRSDRQIYADIRRAQLAYAAFRRTGMATHAELDRAWARTRERIRELRGELSGSSSGGFLSGGLGKFLGAVAVGAGVKSIIDTSAEFERYETVLGTIEGSSEKARAAMDWVADFAKRTPYELSEVTEAFVKLKAYGLDPMKDGLMQTLGDTAAAMGKPVMQMVEAIADAVTGENERLKEFGVKASKKGGQIAYSFTDSEGKQQTLQASADNRAEIQATLQTIFNQKYKGAMDKLSNTWEGLTSNLADNWQSLKREIGKAGLFDGAKRALKGLVDYLGQLSADDLKAFARALTEIGKAAAFLGAAYGVYRLNNALLGAIGSAGSLKTLLQGIGMSAKASLLPFLKIAAVLYGIYLIVDDIMVWLDGGQSVLGELIGSSAKWQMQIDWVKEKLGWVWEKLGEIKDALGGAGQTTGKWLMKIAALVSVGMVVFKVLMLLFGATKVVALGIRLITVAMAANPILLAIMAVIAAIWLLYNNWDTVVAYLLAAWDWVKAKASAAWQAVTAWALATWERIKAACLAAWNAVWQSATQMWNSIQQKAIGAWRAISSSASSIWGGIINTVNGLWDTAIGYFKDKWAAAVAAVRGWFDWIPGLGGGSINVNHTVNAAAMTGAGVGVRAGGVVNNHVTQNITANGVQNPARAAAQMGRNAYVLKGAS